MRAMLRRLLRWPDGFIAVFVALQLLLPLSYYVARLDRHDERFAWRMFSPTRMVTCGVVLTVDGAALPQSRFFHQAWAETATRGRRVVLEAMGAHLCRSHKTVTARLECKPIASQAARAAMAPPPPGVSRLTWYRGAPYYMGGFNLCEIPEL
jgi:hypothetical protein